MSQRRQLSIAVSRHDEINRLISNIKGEFESDILTDINDRSRRRRHGIKVSSALEAMRLKGDGSFLNFASELLARNQFVAHGSFAVHRSRPAR